MEKKMQEEENPVEVNVNREWDRQAKSKLRKELLPVFCEMRALYLMALT